MNKQIDLHPEKAICLLHGAVFRPKWPAGYAVWSYLGLKRLLDCQDFADSLDGDLSRVPASLVHKPLCCQLAERQMLLPTWRAANQDAEFLVVARCDLCQQQSTGTSFAFEDAAGRHELTHACLRCLVAMEPEPDPRLN